MSEQLRLYSLRRNSAGWRVRIALHYKQVPFEYVAQSNAILELLEERYPDPPLLPEDDVERAQARAFAQLIACDLHPLNNGRVRNYLRDKMGADEGATLAWYRHWNAIGLVSLEKSLTGRTKSKFCFGDEPSFADIHLIPQLYNARRFGCDLVPYPRLLAVEQAARRTACFIEAAPEKLPDYAGQEPPWL